MIYPRNALGSLARAKHFDYLYKDCPNVICTMLIFIGLLPYLVNPTCLLWLVYLMQMVAYGVLLFVAISRNLITGEKTKQQRRTFYLIAGVLQAVQKTAYPGILCLVRLSF